MYQNTTGISSWGAPVPETAAPQQWSGEKSQSETQDDSSDGEYYDDDDEESDEDDDYAPLQMGAWGAQPTGPDADASAIQMPNWNDRPTEGTPSLTFSSADWGKLIDPNVVVKSGIGSGNLHRRGANYKPVDEQFILNQRLKIGPPPPSGKKKKRGGAGKKKKGPPPPPFHPSVAHRPVGKPVPSTLRAPLAQSAWGSQLASTPFWESSGAKASKHAPPNLQRKPQSQPPAAAKPPATRLPTGRPPPSAASKWLTQPLQTNPVAPPPTPASNKSLQENTAPTSKWANQVTQTNSTAASRWANQPLQGNPGPSTPSQYQPSQVFPSKALGTSASKYAPAQPASAPAPQPPQPAPQQVPQQAPAPAPIPAQSTIINGTISLSGPAPVTPPRKTIFQLNIELIPGVSAILPVYETDDYSVLVKEFGAKHHLTIAPEAEFTFAEKIKQMVAALRKQQQEQQEQQGF